MPYNSSSNSPSVQVLHQQIWGWGVKDCTDNADARGGSKIREKLTDVEHENFLHTPQNTPLLFKYYFSILRGVKGGVGSPQFGKTSKFESSFVTSLGY